MYRQYEDPAKTQKLLDEAKARLNSAIYAGQDDIIDLHENVVDLEERLNFAWQDEEVF